nr:MAG TPA: hypothetical protein [Bacteriophage sp.]
MLLCIEFLFLSHVGVSHEKNKYRWSSRAIYKHR